LIPKSCRLFGQDHASRTKAWSEMAFKEKPSPSMLALAGTCTPLAHFSNEGLAGDGHADPAVV
jgi:hypothetical protein